MESITKNRQSRRALRAMGARAYGADLVPDDDERWVGELGHGWFNAAYRIRLRDGRNVVLKIAPPPAVEVMAYERGAMEVELAALTLIREHTGAPVPEVECCDGSRALCDAHYFFMPYIEADNLEVIRARLSPAELDACHERAFDPDFALPQFSGMEAVSAKSALVVKTAQRRAWAPVRNVLIPGVCGCFGQAARRR